MRLLSHKGLVIGSLLAIISLMAAACSQDATPAATQAAATPVAAPTATAAPTPAPSEDYAELIFAQKDYPPTNLPASSYLSPPLSPMYDRPVIINADLLRSGKGSLTYEPLIFTDWGFTKDFRGINVTITDKAKFHNGKPVTSTDLVSQYNDYFGTPEVKKIELSMSSGKTNEKTKATVTGAQTFQIAKQTEGTISPSHLFDHILRRWSGVIPMETYLQMGFAEFNDSPIGSGPYRFVSRSPGLLKFERTGTHHVFDPKAKAISVLLVPESSVRLSLIQAGRLDVADEVNLDDAKTAQTLGYTLFSDPASKYVKMYFGGTVSGIDKGVAPWATDDEKGKKVRKALALAVDVDTMCKELVLGLCNPITGDHPTPNAAGIPAHGYDLAKAKSLLAEAGYPDCFPIAMPQIVIGGAPRIPAEHQAVANYFEKLGCKTTITPWDWSVSLAEWSAPHKAETTDGKIWAMSITTFFGAADRDWQFYDEPYRISGWNDAFVQARVDEMLAARDWSNPAFNVAEKALLEYMHEKVGYIPLYAIPEISIIGPGFVRWDNPGHSDDRNIHGLVFKR